MRGCATTSARAALDDHLAEMEHGDALGEVERHVHVVLDHDDGDVTGDGADEAEDVATLLDREPGERLVEQQDPGLLGQRHGDLDPAALAVGGLGERPIGEMAQAHAVERRPRLGDQRLLPAEPDERVPAQRA